ncbi:MAG TPA: DMT family transporter [Pseudonocardiaceae bacterium]
MDVVSAGSDPVPAGSRQLAGVALAALSGLALATQSRINGQLAAALRDIDPHAGALDGELAGLISTVLGLVLLALFVPAVPFGRRGLRRLGAALRTGRLRWWQCAGGLSGAVLVSTQGVTVTALGVAVFTVAVVAGLVLASLAVDRAGLGPQGPRPLSTRRTVGALLAVPAVGIAVANQFGHTGLLLLAVLPLVAGAGTAWQQAMNGQVTAQSGDSMVASLVNFVVATTALVLVAIVPVAVLGLPSRLPGTWWLYLGGALGIVLIASAATSVRLVGVLVMGLSSVAGQLVGALVLEIVAPAGPPGSLLFPVVGTVLALVAVVVAGLARRGGSAKMAP